MYEIQNILLHLFPEPYKGTIYHYTSGDGLAGIIGNHEIWMSNTAFMNDTTELSAIKNQSLFTKDDFTNEYVKQAWEEVRQESTPDNIYMASFSRVKDSLEQWRAYGDFCIGFDIKGFSLKKEETNLYKCLYRSNDIKKWILNKEKEQVWDKLESKDIKKILAATLFYIARMKYKDEHFKSEKEIRLLTTSNHNWSSNDSPKICKRDLPIHTRSHSTFGFQVPYVKFFIEREIKATISTMKEKEMTMKERKLKEESTKSRRPLPITEVMIGPIAYQKEAKTSCEILLAEKGYKDVKVSVSKIPYRGV
jgi:hypothetical protein